MISIHVERPIEVDTVRHPGFAAELEAWARMQPPFNVDVCRSPGGIEFWVHGGDQQAFDKLKVICDNARRSYRSGPEQSFCVIVTNMDTMEDVDEVQLVWAGADA